MAKELNKVKGRQGEDETIDYIQKAGMSVLCRNYRTPYGEADIVAIDEQYLVFIEVKARTGNRFGQGRESVNKAKQERYAGIALCYIQKNGMDNKPVRFDVAEVHLEQNKKIVYLKNAFEGSNFTAGMGDW